MEYIYFDVSCFMLLFEDKGFGVALHNSSALFYTHRYVNEFAMASYSANFYVGYRTQRMQWYNDNGNEYMCTQEHKQWHTCFNV